MGLMKANIENHEKVGEMAGRAAGAKAATHKTKALITPLVEAKEDPEVLTRERVDRQDR